MATVLQLLSLVLIVAGASVAFGLGGFLLGLGVAGFVFGVAMEGDGD